MHHVIYIKKHKHYAALLSAVPDILLQQQAILCCNSATDLNLGAIQFASLFLTLAVSIVYHGHPLPTKCQQQTIAHNHLLPHPCLFTTDYA